MSPTRAPLVLIVLDGWGLRDTRDHNAVALARTPTYLELLERYPHGSLVTSGDAVGLPVGQMGNSEVGHMNLGAGRVVYQDLTRIDRAITDADWFDNPALAASMTRCVDDRHALHLVGLVSDGGVHSHQRHLDALIEMATRLRVPRVFVQAVTDGRDTAPTGGADFVAALERTMADAGTARVASISGRYYAMDRDRRWDRTRLAYEALTRGTGPTAAAAKVLIADAYAAGVTDEFIEPGVVVDAAGCPIGPVADGDSVVFFNFRADRARQLTRALAFDDFEGFERQTYPRVHVTTMTEYDATFGLPVAFPPNVFSPNLADVLADQGLSNLRLAETEKYAHVTYFFNCGEERPYPGEARILVPSPKVPTYDLKPEMSAHGITEQLLADVNGTGHDVIICNFANADMVGTHGRSRRRDLGRLDLGSVPDSDRLSGRARRWHRHHHRRPWQRRADVGCAAERAAHGTHDQPRASGDRAPRAARSRVRAAGRFAPRHRPDDVGYLRALATIRDDGRRSTDLGLKIPAATRPSRSLHRRRCAVTAGIVGRSP